MKISEFCILECLCVYRFYIVIFLMLNSLADYSQNVVQIEEVVLQMSSNQGVGVWLCFAVPDIYRLIDLESLFEKYLMIIYPLLKV